MKRLIFIVVLLVSMALISSCSAGNEKAISPPTPTPNATPVEDLSKKLSALAEKGGSKQELLAGLIEKGDRASKDETDGEHKRARWVYTFATLFDPKNADVAAKLKSLGGQVTEADYDAKLRAGLAMASVIGAGNMGEIFGGFPKPVSEMEVINLRMLLDERLTGDLGYSPWKMGSSNSELWFFSKDPTIDMNEVRAIYGKPSTERKDSSGSNVITYGLLRFLSDADGKIESILFPTVDRHIPKRLMAIDR